MVDVMMGDGIWLDGRVSVQDWGIWISVYRLESIAFLMFASSEAISGEAV